MNNLIVGDEGCSFSKLVTTMCKGVGKSVLFKSWFTLALHLGTHEDDVDKLRQELLLDLKDIAKIVSDLLIDWRSRNGSKATMSALIDILEDGCEWKAIADALYDEFKMEIGENTRWTDLHKRTQNEILGREVLFLGSTKSLKSILSELNETQQHKIKESFKGSMILKMLNPGEIHLTREVIPEIPKVYIPRMLSTRRKIDPKLFQVECPDIFVVQNISLIKLSEFSGKHRVDKSNRQAEDLTVRFISLESPAHFENICEQAKLNSVHLINYRNENFHWVKTHGNLHQIQAHLHDDICIADNPGMGKTLLLANLCQRRRSQNPEKYIIYANFTEIFGIKPDNAKAEDKATKNTWQNIVKHMSENEVGQEIFTQVFMTEPEEVEIFLDGFDEIPTPQLHHATYHLKSFAIKLKGVKVYITTRVHRQVELERALGTLSFNILPFSESDQTKFFRETWNRDYSISSHSNLEKFASFLVAEMRSKFSSKENDITGVPLQCSMLAEIYHKAAKRNARSSDKPCDISLRINSIHEMYEKLLKIRLQTIKDEKRRTEVLRVHQLSALEFLLPSAFLKYFETRSSQAALSLREDVNRVGLLTFGESLHGSESIRFLHKTYAEFILADWLVASLRRMDENERSLANLIVLREILLFEILDVKGSDGGVMLDTPECSVFVVWDESSGSKGVECREEWVKLARALNFGPEDISAIHGQLKFNKEKDLPKEYYDGFCLLLYEWTQNSKRQPPLVELVDALRSLDCDDLAATLEFRFYSNSFQNETLCFFLNTCLERSQITLNLSNSEDDFLLQIFRVLEACAFHDFKNLFRLISRHYQSFKDHSSFQTYCQTDLLYKVMRKSNTILLEECCSFVEEMEGKPLHQIKTRWKCFGVWEYTPLHAACHRGDLSSFLFLFQKYEQRVLGMKGLLHYCTWNSLNDSEEVVDARIEIIEHLLKINPAFLEEREPSANSTPIMMSRVDLRLLKFLLANGADARAIDEDGDTLVESATGYFSPEEFHRLTELLLENGCGDVFLMRNKRGSIQLQYCFEFVTIKVETVALIAAHVTKDFNISGCEGTTLLCSAVIGLQEIEILKALVEFGADPERRENDGQTMVHTAAFFGNVEAIGYLCSLGCDVNARDSHQRTALHTVVTMGRRNLDEVVMALLKQPIDMEAIDDEGHSALWYAEKMEDFRKLKHVTLQALRDAAEVD